MENYTLHRLDHPKYDWVVFSIHYERCDQYIEELISELKSKNIQSPILIDLLCSNGLSDRFYELSINPFKISKTLIDGTLYEYCNEWYRNHNELLENSVLSKAQKFLFLRNRLKNIYNNV